MMFPKFLLKKMYVRGSLKKETSGFSYVIRNNIANGTIIEVYSLKVDGKEIPFRNVEIVIEGRSRPSNTVSEKNPVSLKKGIETKFLIHSAIESGSHKVEMSFKSKEIGQMRLDFDDQVG